MFAIICLIVMLVIVIHTLVSIFKSSRVEVDRRIHKFDEIPARYDDPVTLNTSHIVAGSISSNMISANAITSQELVSSSGYPDYELRTK